MEFRAILASAALACVSLSGAAAFAAEECGPLKMVTGVKMMGMGNNRLIPVTINGAPKLLMLDTGGYMSQLSRDVTDEMKMKRLDSVINLADLSGNVSRSFVIADTLQLGSLVAQKQPLFVSPGNFEYGDGILSSDLLLRYDVEMDFPGRKLNYFSPDHCKGKVVYWKADAVAAVPITIKDKSRLIIPVKLDGHEFKAIIDTGAFRTTLTWPVAKRVFGLDPDSPGMKPLGNVNGDPKLASSAHTFSTLTFDGVSVTNPTVSIIPDRVAMADTTQQTGNRARTNGEFYQTDEELILGMDVMRHLRMYMAFKEGMAYISPGPMAPTPKTAEEALAEWDELVALSPSNPSMLNGRCYERGLTKTNLEGALSDCELSLKLRPGDSSMIDSKGLVLYQLGRYQDAIDAFDQALKISPKLAPSLFVRGLAKQKLGDTAGGASDIAAAKAINADIISSFRGSDIAEK
ncbi:MAG TPA: aspartyl protease family protein [Rhizomicrobium sp.]|nr:aspartyl protease family protein [Rhizomicrobium sp.]